MNHDALIQQIIEDLKADKSIPAEYRNSVVSSGRRWQCEIRGAKSLAVLKAPESTFENKTVIDTFLSGGSALDMSAKATQQNSGGCTCPAGGVRTTCPIHKGAV